MRTRAHARPHAVDKGEALRTPHASGKPAVPPDGYILVILRQDYASEHPAPAWRPDPSPA